MAATKPQVFTLVYHSTAVPGLSSFDLDEILSVSRARNPGRAVTGMLLAENGRFLQALEGAEDEVRALMTRIEQDPRHEHVRVLVAQVGEARRFPDWAMAHGHVGELEAKPLAEYFEALSQAREELPDPPTKLDRLRAWFRPSRTTP